MAEMTYSPPRDVPYHAHIGKSCFDIVVICDGKYLDFVVVADNEGQANSLVGRYMQSRDHGGYASYAASRRAGESIAITPKADIVGSVDAFQVVHLQQDVPPDFPIGSPCGATVLIGKEAQPHYKMGFASVPPDLEPHEVPTVAKALLLAAARQPDKKFNVEESRLVQVGGRLLKVAEGHLVATTRDWSRWGLGVLDARAVKFI